MSENVPNQPNEEAPAPKTLEQRLAEADILEKERSREFLEQSRPKLIAGHSLPWDRFWSWFGGGLDGILWRWVSPDVEVARAREGVANDKRRRVAKKNQDASSIPTQTPVSDIAAPTVASSESEPQSIVNVEDK